MSQGGPILVVEPGGSAPAGVAAADAEPVVATSVGEAVERVSSGYETDERIGLAVIAPTVPHPLAAGRELRRADGQIGLAFLFGPDEVESMEARLGLVPQLRGAVVVSTDTAPDELQTRLRRTAVTAARRRGVRDAFAEINRRLLEERAGHGAPEGTVGVSESYLATLTRYVPDVIVALDLTGRTVSMNEAAVDILGLEQADVEGDPLTEHVRTQPGDALGRLVELATSGEPQEHEELWVIRPEGERVLLSVTAAPIGDGRDEVVGVVVIARDITAQRRAADRLTELQKSKSLATLAGGVAHDFNNLLVSVQGWAELAREDPSDTETVTTALDSIAGSAARAAELSRAMLAYSGRGEFELHPTDVGEVVAEMAELLRASVDRRIELRLEVDDELPEVPADPTQIRQVVLNLVNNAYEAVGGGGTIAIRTCLRELVGTEARRHPHLPAGRYVALEVTDDGPGMDQATLDRVFEPFFTTKFAGRGLGLAASQGIARAHGGALTAESAPGEGATFALLIPTSEMNS